jgi:hypothetical protein
VNVHFYSEDDIRHHEASEVTVIDGKSYAFSFIADVPGDNPDVLGDYDNRVLADRLTRFGALGKDDRLDCEICCFYAYFRRNTDGLAFLRKLNAYLSQKSRLIREANAF